jgi:hypothetical protein
MSALLSLAMWKNGNTKTNKVCQSEDLTLGKLFPGYRLWCLVLLMGLFFGLSSPQSVRGQVPDTLIVLPPDTEAFPILSVAFKPPNAPSGERFDLDTEDLAVQENGRSVPILALEKQLSGVHFTLAINGDRRFDLRDASGVSPYDRIREALIEWAGSRRFAPEDTLSLFTQEYTAIRNTALREAWIEALENYQPNFRMMTPDLTSLETALRAAEERVVPFGVDKALLYITPPPTFAEISSIVALTEVARSAGIQVNVWMLGEELFLTTDQGGSLRDLAAVTGGQFFHYTGVEPLPNPEVYLEALGVFYTLRFDSGIREGGTYTIRVIADLPGGEMRGESDAFFIDIQPPKPIFLSPPAAILREAPPGWEGDLENLVPASMDIEFLLEFPDHYPRDLATARLYVDGRLADEQNEAPFGTLTWTLTNLVEPGEHSLQVKVEDVLGLQGETIIIPIQLEVQLPEAEEIISARQIGWTVVGGILAVSIILLFIWAIRRFLQSAFAQRAAKKIFDSARKARPPVNIDQADQVFATLLPLTSAYPEGERAAIMITKRQIAFGCDPSRADQVLKGEEIAGLHARLRVREGECWLSDSGSDGGTWINYNLIGRDPVQLHPGDLIHFGAVGFRFTVIDPESPPNAAVSKFEPIS